MNDHGVREKLGTLMALGYLEELRNVDAKPNEAVRYQIADAAVRFYHRFVVPNASQLERYPAAQLWPSSVALQVGSYMGYELECIAAQAYDQRVPSLGLPQVSRWGRWEGVDRLRRSLEIDLFTELTDGRWMSGAVK